MIDVSRQWQKATTRIVPLPAPLKQWGDLYKRHSWSPCYHACFFCVNLTSNSKNDSSVTIYMDSKRAAQFIHITTKQSTSPTNVTWLESTLFTSFSLSLRHWTNGKSFFYHGPRTVFDKVCRLLLESHRKQSILWHSSQSSRNRNAQWTLQRHR